MAVSGWPAFLADAVGEHLADSADRVVHPALAALGWASPMALAPPRALDERDAGGVGGVTGGDSAEGFGVAGTEAQRFVDLFP